MKPLICIAKWRMRSLLAIITGLLSGCTSAPDRRLVGTWVSDSQATVSYNRSLAPQMDWNKYSQLFGRLRVIYDGTNITSDLDGSIERGPIWIMRRDIDTLTLKIHDRIDEKDRLLTFHFVDQDTYWIQIRDTDHREYFRRVRQSKN